MLILILRMPAVRVVEIVVIGENSESFTRSMPVWATIFASIFGYEKINISIIISLIFGMFGIFFLSIEINIFENIFGFLITLSAGLSWFGAE